MSPLPRPLAWWILVSRPTPNPQSPILSSMIVIIDYGMGNLRSVQKGFEHVGHEAIVTSDPDEVARAEKVVLPGVGAFEDAMAELRRRRLVEPVLGAIDSGKPFLGDLPRPATACSTSATKTAATRASACWPARSSGSSCRRDTPSRTWAGTNC